MDIIKMKEANPAVVEETLETLKAWKSGEIATFKKAASERWPQVSRFA